MLQLNVTLSAKKFTESCFCCAVSKYEAFYWTNGKYGMLENFLGHPIPSDGAKRDIFSHLIKTLRKEKNVVCFQNSIYKK